MLLFFLRRMLYIYFKYLIFKYILDPLKKNVLDVK